MERATIKTTCSGSLFGLFCSQLQVHVKARLIMVLNMVMAWVPVLSCDCARSSVVGVVAGMVLALSH